MGKRGSFGLHRVKEEISRNSLKVSFKALFCFVFTRRTWVKVAEGRIRCARPGLSSQRGNSCPRTAGPSLTRQVGAGCWSGCTWLWELLRVGGEGGREERRERLLMNLKALPLLEDN